jgi:hypothetical protein
MALPATDDFNRASLGANWAVMAGAPSCDGAAYVPTGSGDNSARWVADAFANDHYSQAQIAAAVTSGENQVLARCAGTNNQYGAATNCATYKDLYKVVAGSYTDLGQQTTGAIPTTGDTIRIEAQGTTLRFVLNGVTQFSLADSSLASGAAGVNVWVNGATPNGKLDNWQADNLGGKKAPPPVQRTLRVWARARRV